MVEGTLEELRRLSSRSLSSGRRSSMTELGPGLDSGSEQEEEIYTKCFLTAEKCWQGAGMRKESDALVLTDIITLHNSMLTEGDDTIFVLSLLMKDERRSHESVEPSSE